MAAIATGTVTQNNLTGSQLLYTDTGTGYGTITSRTLNVYDCNNNLLFTFNMGTNLTQVVTITADAWFKFVCTVVDNTGTYSAEVDYVAIGFYTAAYLEQFVSTNCGCQLDNCNLDIAENFLNAALRYNLAGNGIASNANIVAANIYVNMSPVVQYV